MFSLAASSGYSCSFSCIYSYCFSGRVRIKQFIEKYSLDEIILESSYSAHVISTQGQKNPLWKKQRKSYDTCDWLEDRKWLMSLARLRKCLRDSSRDRGWSSPGPKIRGKKLGIRRPSTRLASVTVKGPPGRSTRGHLDSLEAINVSCTGKSYPSTGIWELDQLFPVLVTLIVQSLFYCTTLR